MSTGSASLINFLCETNGVISEPYEIVHKFNKCLSETGDNLALNIPPSINDPFKVSRFSSTRTFSPWVTEAEVQKVVFLNSPLPFTEILNLSKGYCS